MIHPDLRAKYDGMEIALRKCLERWVSEMEPTMVIDENSQFLGLAVKDQIFGRPKIIVWATLR